MGFRFWRRVKILPGVTLNLSKGGVSTSFGGEGAKITVGKNGIRRTVGLPGTGLYYTKYGSNGRKVLVEQEADDQEEYGGEPADLLHVGWWGRLFMDADEKAFLDGCLLLLEDCVEDALDIFGDSPTGDCEILAGFCALALGQYGRAQEHLARAWASDTLDVYFARYGVDTGITIPVTPWVSVRMLPDKQSIAFGLVEVHQKLGQIQEARRWASRLVCLDPDNLEARISLCELLTKIDVFVQDDIGKADAERVLALAAGIQNKGASEATLILYRAKAMRRLGMAEAGRKAAKAGQSPKKGRPIELLRALKLEEALGWAAEGKTKQAKVRLESLYGETPENEEIKAALKAL